MRKLLSAILLNKIFPGGPNWDYYKGSVVPEGNIPPILESSEQSDGGLLDFVINNSPWKFHLTDKGDNGKVRKMNWCGPGTKAQERLDRGDRGINEMDKGCKQHDIAYMKYKTAKKWHPYDLILVQKAAKIANNPSKPERQRKTARRVLTAMALKSFVGLGASRVQHGNGLSQKVAKLVDYSIEQKKRKHIQANQLWSGTNIKLYKNTGEKKTKRELKDELYLGVKWKRAPKK